MSRKYMLEYDDEHENPYRLQALLLIEQDREVPDELEYDKKHCFTMQK